MKEINKIKEKIKSGQEVTQTDFNSGKNNTKHRFSKVSKRHSKFNNKKPKRKN